MENDTIEEKDTTNDVSTPEDINHGKWTVFWLKVILVLIAGGYICLHCFTEPFGPERNGADLVILDAYGTATVKSKSDLEWYVGSKDSEPIVTSLNTGNGRIANLKNQLRDSLREVVLIAYSLSTEQNPINGTKNAFTTFDYSKFLPPPEDSVYPDPFQPLNNNLVKLCNSGLSKENMVKVGECIQVIGELKQERTLQKALVDSLKTPYAFSLFWMSNFGIIVEAMVWTIFGLITSLLYVLCWKLRHNSYQRNQGPIIWAKFFYAPIVTVVFIMIAWIEIAGNLEPQTRIWSIPLLGFLLGMNCRKAVDITDNFSESILQGFQKKMEQASVKFTKDGKVEINNESGTINVDVYKNNPPPKPDSDVR
jgi:hypothetical protein